ncbi:MAG: anti-sigma factor [Acidobacteriaceae bacterium]|nr:anti-sigma factor [Acidobacteriaceae bacterium]
MRFECGDLDRALSTPELMAEAREHLKGCAACRREYRLWTEISAAAKELHEEWESPELWRRIRESIDAEPKPKPIWWKEWRTWAIAAVVLIGVVGLAVMRPWGRATGPASPESSAVELNAGNRDFLTEQALKEVEKTENAYRQSIDKLSKLAEPELSSASPVAVNYREKLVMLDSAISETRANLDQNRFNLRLQTELANLYQEKQQTLRELLTRDQKN